MSERDLTQLVPAFECLLFVTGEPLTPERLAKVLGIEVEQVDAVADAMAAALEGRGLALTQVAGGYQLVTRPAYIEYVHRLIEPEPERLSPAALETLACVAYRQPITRPEIDAIRGVNSSGVVHTLCEKGLVESAGRKDTVGRPQLYRTTRHFLHSFGLKDLSELPLLDSLQAASEQRFPLFAQPAAPSPEGEPQPPAETSDDEPAADSDTELVTEVEQPAEIEEQAVSPLASTAVEY